MSEARPVRGYDDINENLRYWFSRLFSQGPLAAGTSDGPVFYDIGANDGVFTRAFAASFRAAYCFEADPDTHRRLVDRLAEDLVGHARTFQVALGASSGTARIERFSDDSFNSLYRRTDFELGHYSLAHLGSLEVPVESLDELRAREGLAAPTGIKIDVEGAELAVLSGAAATIAAHRPWMVVEYSVDNTSNAGYDRREILQLLLKAGYRVGGLYRNVDIHLYEGPALESRRIWNLVAMAPTLAESFSDLFRDVVDEG